MKYKGTLIVVKDCNRALKFYRDMFGLQLLQDNDGNMELSDHLYLQELGYWEDFTEKRIISNSNQSELYFEEPDIEKFVARLELLYPETEYVNRLMTHSWGQTIDTFNTSDTRGNSPSYGTNYQKLGKELMSRDELAVMDGSKCVLQLRGVRPFLSDKYDLTQHPNYKYTADYDKKLTFDIEKYLSTRAKLYPKDEFFVMEEEN